MTSKDGYSWESQYRLQSHFQDFIMAELSATGVTQASHPMIHAFVERRAILLRDFVFSGVSLSRQIRVEELERLTGDTMLRVDTWDQLRSHIDMAEKRALLIKGKQVERPTASLTRA